MALTQSQEEILKKIIEAFQNGKRLSDLPMAKGTNPYDLYVEVLDIDGESKKAKLADMLPYMEDQVAYGIEFDTTVSSPECTRIGNISLHRTLPVQSRMRGCLLDDDGKVVEYLDPTDWRSNIRGGSRGQVMVEIPEHYRRFVTDGTKRRVMLSEYPLPGYHKVPLCYISAYEAALERSTRKLCSVVNTAADYRGGINDAGYDNTGGSQLGRPVAGHPIDTLRTYARNRNPESVEWNIYTNGMHKTLTWLFVVEYATFNSQAAYNAQLTAEGYRQGGLGMGVCDLNYDNCTALNKNQPVIPCGFTDMLGNRSGVVSYTMPAEYGADKAVGVPRYRGIENPFGHCRKFIDGIIVRAHTTDNINVFVCDDPARFNSTDTSGYSHVANVGNVTGTSFIREIFFGETGELIPKVTGGSSSTYFCDYFDKSAAAGTYCVAVGDGCTGWAGAGLFKQDHSHGPDYSTQSLVTRLCFIPNN